MDEHPATTPPWHRQCVCGHLEGDHKSNRSPIAGFQRSGVCLRRGCECREYRPVTELDRLEAENRRLRELLATLGWGPARLKDHLDVPTPGVESTQRP